MPTIHTTPTTLPSHTFNYIICGGGTAGCVLAARLSTLPNISVLLVEAGRDSGLYPDTLIPGKYVRQLSEDHDGLWELPTVPQKELNGRQLMFLRGRQVGGSSAVNYMAMARGPAADYDDWAALSGDEGWKWENILHLMKELEDFNPTVPAGFEQFARPRDADHGKGGPLKIGYGDTMVPGVSTFIQACMDTGIPLCLDNNSGNPVGVGLAQFNVRDGERSYAANAFLDEKMRRGLKNLTVLTNTECDRVYCREGRVTGVELFHRIAKTRLNVECKREVIVSAGTFGSPKILMLSGIGPKEALQQHDIPVTVDLPGVGQNMLDHSILTTEYKVDNSVPAHNQIFLNSDLLAQSERQYARDKTGPLAVYGSSGSVAFPRIPALYHSPEFEDLDPGTQKFLLEPTRPSAEIWLGSGPSVYSGEIKPEDSFITHEMLLQNNLSRGSVTLQSKNPRDLPVIDPKFLSHPFDKRIAIETVRTALKVGQSHAYEGTIQGLVHGPDVDFHSVDPDHIDDDTLLEFIRKNLGQGYHSLGTCKMGKEVDPTAVVDAQFKVFGIRNLRVADLSVCPILTSNHTQINAYLIGERCAQKIISEHMASPATSKL